MSILNDAYCYYCQREYASVSNLHRHIERMHPDTYASATLKAYQNGK